MMVAAGSDSLNQETVLIVDFHQEHRMGLAAMLRDLSYDVIEAEDGNEALALFQEHKPWLVITEVFLPQLDGFDMTRQLKLLAGDIFVPVLFITRSRDGEMYERCVEAGGDDFLHGPLSGIAVLKAKLSAMQRISMLYHEVHGLHRFLKREEEVAEELLSSAIECGNSALDQVRIYKRSASTFCGDVQLTAFRPDGDLNVLLGDFTGHGLTSVIGALPLSETFRAMTRKGYSGEEILQQINDKLKALLPQGMFLATAMVTLSSAEGRASVWNCGMPDVLVMSGETGDLKYSIASADPPLGIMTGFTPMSARQIALGRDDRILLLSDGLPEARNPDGDMFGEERLLAAAKDGMAVCNLADRVMYAVSSFMGKREQDDDVSLIEIPGQVIPPIIAATPGAMGFREAPLQAVTTAGGWSWSVKLEGDSLRRINPVPMLLSQLQEMEEEGEHWQIVFTILTELYVNALDHGVLGVDSELKSSAEGFARYFEEREQRLNSLEDGFVEVDLVYQPAESSSGGRLELRVQDSGNGFDLAAWQAERCCEQLETDPVALCGRGICLVEELADSLEYSDGGRCAEVVFSW